MDNIQTILDSHLLKWNLVAPTYAAAVFNREGILAFGSRSFDPRFGSPHLETVFRIASMSKSFLAVAILNLVQRGHVVLDSSVSNYVPQFKPRQYGDVTVRMLLANCSGLPEDNAWVDHHLGMSKKDFLAMTSEGFGFTEPPGHLYQYSNVGFTLASLVVENVSGLCYEEFLRQEVLDPLDLVNTRYSAERYDSSHDLAAGFSTFDNGENWILRVNVPSGAPAPVGGLFSTVSDIASWSGWLSSAFCELDPDSEFVSARSDSVLSRELRVMMQTIHTPIHSVQGREVSLRNDVIGYGLGVIVEEDCRFGRIVQHSGGLPGFSTNMRWHTDSGVGAVVYATTERQRMATKAADLLTDILLELDVPARRIKPWSETVQAAKVIDAMLTSGGDFSSIGGLVSDNVFYEEPLEVRQSKFEALAQSIGGIKALPCEFSSRLMWCASAAQLVWRIPGNNGDLQARIELAEVPGRPVQRVVVEEIGDEMKRVPPGRDLVVRHYLPVIP